MDEEKEILNETTEENALTEQTDDISEKFQNIENELLFGIEQSEDVQVRKKNGRLGKILLVLWIVIMTVFVVGISVYCIASDIANKNFSGFSPAERHDFVLNTYGKPGGNEAYVDENGKYTVEGLATVVRPQIVEIYTYEEENSEKAVGSGSGIIISSDGYIVTNAHVLNGMKKFVVITHDEKTYEAEISGKDSKTDIAVIKIDAQGLVPAQFGNSDEVVQGEAVVAIGNPVGLTGTITDGIVSGVNRKVRSSYTGYEMNCIQTDAAISPGNSGGALVNMYGQVIGITSSKYAIVTTEGLGFAITINEAKPIIEELVSQGYVSGRVKIGITFYTSDINEIYIAAKFEDEFGFEMPEELKTALWINEISDDCDISNTELKKNDFIVEFDGKPISNYSQLEEFLKGKKGGDVVKAKCARLSKDGKISYFEIEFKLMSDTSGDY